MEQPPPALFAPEPTLDEPPPSSLVSRFFNVLVAPSEVFDDLKARSVAHINWVVPMVLAVLASWVATTVINSQDFARQQMTAIQEKALQPQVERGKMTREQADQTAQTIVTVMKVTAYAGAPFGVAASLFLGALVVWLLGTKALKGQFTFMKGVEVMGLISLIGILAQIVRVSVVLVKEDIMASPSMALLLKDVAPTDPRFSVLSVLNPFTFWWLGLVCIGLVRLTGASFTRAAVWVFGIWATFTAGMIGLAMLAMRLAPK